MEPHPPRRLIQPLAGTGQSAVTEMGARTDPLGSRMLTNGVLAEYSQRGRPMASMSSGTSPSRCRIT